MKSIDKARKAIAGLYASKNPDDLGITDLLALDRTILANERTFLAFVRTGFMIVASGFTLIKLFPESVYSVYAGYALIPVGAYVIYFGYRRYQRTRKALLWLNQNPDEILRELAME